MKGTILALAAGIVAVALAASASAMSANRLVGSTGPDSAFNITLKKGKTKVTKLKHGKYTIVVRDAGRLGHEFVVIKTKRRASKLPVKGTRAVETGRVGKIPTFKPGQTKKLTLTLKPGHYALICNLPAHYKSGQRVDFTVK